MPVFDLGFDAANPANWGIVKGFSAIRHYERQVDNRYEGGRFDFTWDVSADYSLVFGFNRRRFSFETQQRERNTDNVNPTEREVGVTTASLGRVVEFGQGLDTPPGSVTSFFVPDLDAFDRAFDFKCSCVNRYGDWRTIRRNNGRDDFGVTDARGACARASASLSSSFD